MGKEFITIANCSGFYGDKLSAAKEVVNGGPIDCLLYTSPSPRD